MLTEDKLSQLSEEELEKLYQEKKAKYDQKLAKNRRIRGILSRKVDSKQEIVNELKNKINIIITKHPEVVKQDFDDTNQHVEELKDLIKTNQSTLSTLQSKKTHLESEIKQGEAHIERQKTLEEKIQQEITSLISNSKLLEIEDSESKELEKLSQEIQSAQELLEALIKETEIIHNKIHQLD